MKPKRLTRESILNLLQKHNQEIKRRFSVRKLGLFGSYARNAGRGKSDIDFLVEFERPTFDGYMDLKFFLEQVLGREVDLALEETLKPRLRGRIAQEVRRVEGL